MPLKHHTETAYMLLLGLVTCATGFLIALLPQLPESTIYVSLIAFATFLYPILFMKTLKENRADYEFRMLHWFPFSMTILWVALAYLGPKAKFLTILQLGFFFLWSLPLVALGITFLILFAVHVIRRSRIRILLLSLFLLLFTGGAIVSEAMGFDPAIRRFIYPEQDKFLASTNSLLKGARDLIATVSGTASVQVQGSMSSQSSSVSSVGTLSSLRSSRMSSRSAIAAVTSKNSSILSSVKPSKLPQSGPETAAVLASTLLGLYMATVHLRARKRV